MAPTAYIFGGPGLAFFGERLRSTVPLFDEFAAKSDAVLYSSAHCCLALLAIMQTYMNSVSMNGVDSRWRRNTVLYCTGAAISEISQCARSYHLLRAKTVRILLLYETYQELTKVPSLTIDQEGYVLNGSIQTTFIACPER